MAKRRYSGDVPPPVGEGVGRKRKWKHGPASTPFSRLVSGLPISGLLDNKSIGNALIAAGTAINEFRRLEQIGRAVPPKNPPPVQDEEEEDDDE